MASQFWRFFVGIDVSALGSVELTLDDVLDRLGRVCAETNDDDEVATELREVERQLTMASRRLSKALRRLDR